MFPEVQRGKPFAPKPLFAYIVRIYITPGVTVKVAPRKRSPRTTPMAHGEDSPTRPWNPALRTGQDHAVIVDKREIGAYYFLHYM
jgi:hypothetical protein